MYVHIILQEENTAQITQLHHEISEKTSYISVLETETANLKTDNKKLTKHFGQNREEVQTKASLLKICKYRYLHVQSTWGTYD